jgi:hypothetical protein
VDEANKSDHELFGQMIAAMQLMDTDKHIDSQPLSAM